MRNSPFSVLFPAFEHGLREPDPSFHKEIAALETAGIPIHVVEIESLISGDVSKAFRFVGEPSSTCIIYRGWILHPSEYGRLDRELSSRGFNLFTPPKAYDAGLLFPEFFPPIECFAIPAVWIEGDDLVAAVRAAQSIGDPPYYIKDYAKSAKEISPRGCIVAEGDLEKEMSKAISALKEYRGDRFEGGIVIRPFLKLRYLDECPFGGPVFEEYRLFFFNGILIAQTAYDRIGGDPDSLPDYSYLGELIPSPFFSVDIVVTAEGKPLILEVGDGGSSALPPALDPNEFYRRISEVMSLTVD